MNQQPQVNTSMSTTYGDFGQESNAVHAWSPWWFAALLIDAFVLARVRNRMESQCR